MAKTKVVQKNVNSRRSEAKGSLKRGFVRYFFYCFSVFNAKRLTIKAFLEVRLVSLNLTNITSLIEFNGLKTIQRLLKTIFQ